MKTVLMSLLLLAFVFSASADITVSPSLVVLVPDPWDGSIAINETFKAKATFNVTLDGIDQEEADAEGGEVYYQHDWNFFGQGEGINAILS